MKLLIIHISDIHLEKATESIRSHLLMVADAVRNEERQLASILLLISGDIAWSGNRLEYAIAKEYLEELYRKLHECFPGVQISTLAVPGNHDCDFKTPSKSRDLNIKGIREEGSSVVDETVIATCTASQDEFFRFAASLPNSVTPLNSPRLYISVKISVGEANILLHCFNTAWISELHEQPGTLHFPIDNISLVSDGSEYSAAVFHHPYNWLPANNHRRFREAIEEASDLIMTGHEHEADSYTKAPLEGIPSTFLEGAVFHEKRQPQNCGFNAIWIDLSIQRQRIASFHLAGALFEPSYHTDGWIPYTRGCRAGRDFDLSEEFTAFLNDPGAAFLHPAKETLSFADIYILPNFRERKAAISDKTIRPYIRGRDFLTRLLTKHRRSLILAHQQAGKTALAKAIFRFAYESNLTPVLVSGDDIGSNPDIKRFESIVESALKKQYRNPLLPTFAQLDSERILIIVDDFDHCRRLSSKGRTELLRQLKSRYERICILGDEVLGLEELATGKANSDVLKEFSPFDLEEFGHKLRHQLIEKWYSIGSEYTLEEHEVRNRTEKAAELLRYLLRQSHLPSFPVFVLTFLQSQDSDTPLTASAGTYGSLFEVLITQEMAKARSKTINLDLRQNYLSELAYWMFAAKKRVISDSDWRAFHEHYNATYQLQLTKKDLQEDVIGVGVIQTSDESYSFKYSYQYYYFAARYFRNNLHLDEVRHTIQNLFQQFHREEHSSIWLFLTHLSKDPFIVDAVTKHAKKVFDRMAPAGFGDEMSIFDEIYQSIPRIVLDDIDYRQRSDERLDRLDAQENQGRIEATEDKYEADPEAEEHALLRELSSALKTIEVLGQLIKNFHGSLRGDQKFAVVKETYDLGLRTVEAILRELRENSDNLVRSLIDMVRRKYPEIEMKSDIEDKVKRSIFYVMESACFALVKRISQAIGHAALEATYKDVGLTCETNAYSLIDLSVQLDSKGPPMSDLHHWATEFSDNQFCRRLTRQLFAYHLYIFSLPESKRQSICAILEINLKPGATNDLLSPGGKIA